MPVGHQLVEDLDVDRTAVMHLDRHGHVLTVRQKPAVSWRHLSRLHFIELTELGRRRIEQAYQRFQLDASARGVIQGAMLPLGARIRAAVYSLAATSKRLGKVGWMISGASIEGRSRTVSTK